jgi:hypothetical protein
MYLRIEDLHFMSFHIISLISVIFYLLLGFCSTNVCPVASTSQEKMILKPPDDGKDPKEWCE